MHTSCNRSTGGVEAGRFLELIDQPASLAQEMNVRFRRAPLSDGGDNPIYLEDIYKHKHCPETERHWLDFLLVHFVGICYLSAISPTEPGRVLRSEAKHNERAEVVLYIFTMRESPIFVSFPFSSFQDILLVPSCPFCFVTKFSDSCLLATGSSPASHC